MGTHPLQVSEEDLSPNRLLIMEGKAVNRMDDHGDTRKFSGQATQESAFGIMGMNDMIGIPF
jgi:hypothetical protein